MSLRDSSRRAALASCAAFLLLACAAQVARAQGGGWVGGRQGLQGSDLNAVYFTDSKASKIGSTKTVEFKSQGTITSDALSRRYITKAGS